jgi:organic hydroperoxide reductase OsmC/OhrA
VELVVNVPELAREQAEALVRTAHEVCPYSNATRGNVEVTLTLV